VIIVIVVQNIGAEEFIPPVGGLRISCGSLHLANKHFSLF